MFTKQHFELIAETLTKIENVSERQKTAEKFIELFKANNPRFNEKLFRKATNIKKS